MSKIVAFFIIMVLVLAFIVAITGCDEDVSEVKYEKEKIEGTVIEVVESAHVRKSPHVTDDRIETNSYGMTTAEKSFTLRVSELYRSESDGANGAFIGIKTLDILSTAEGCQWFPPQISDDTDGMVWINHKYIDIIA